MKLKQIYSEWSPTTKIMFWLGVVALAVGVVLWIISTFWGPDIYNAFNGNVGLKVSPEMIIYNCNDTQFMTGITRTITLTNYDNQAKEDITLNLEYPSGQGLNVNLNPVDTGVMRGPFDAISMENINESIIDTTFIITSLKPSETVQFDLSLDSQNCSEDIPVRISTVARFIIAQRIYGYS